MAFTAPTYDVDNIQGLADLTQNQATAVKVLFDKTGADTKTFIIALLAELASVSDGDSGADNLGMTAISALGASATVQSIVEALVTQIQSTSAGDSGAKFTGVETISGLTGNDVQTLLEVLNTALGTHAGLNTLHKQASSITQTGTMANAEGGNTTASGNYSHAEGFGGAASGTNSHIQGEGCIASASNSHAEGYATTASVYASHAMGQFNNTLTGGGTFSATADAFVVGNGTSPIAKGNAFRVTFDGKVYGLSAFNSTGADYAEFFEWLDGNVSDEDRVGYFVTLEGEKIRKATLSDSYILGIVSATPSVIGDSHCDDWQGKYLTDIWGRTQYHDVIVPATDHMPEHAELHPVCNPDWDPYLGYIPREKRKEWSAVGLMGKLFVRDDGTCHANGYCASDSNGIATSSTAGYRVLRRVSDNIVQVLAK